jgi:hypothetical protein
MSCALRTVNRLPPLPQWLENSGRLQKFLMPDYPAMFAKQQEISAMN